MSKVQKKKLQPIIILKLHLCKYLNKIIILYCLHLLKVIRFNILLKTINIFPKAFFLKN